MIELRDYQDECVNGVRQAFANGYKSVLVVLPTGGGKTVIFTYIAKTTSSKGKSVLILQHRKELIKQSSEALDNFSVSHGIIKAGITPAFHELVQAASVQTLFSRLQKTPIQPDLIIIDEAHHATAGTWRKIIDFYNCYVIGVTATPVRADGKGLGVQVGGIFDHMVVGPSVEDLMQRGYLMRPRIIWPDMKDRVSANDIKISMGEFNKKQSAEKFDKPSITGKAVDYYNKYCPNQPAVAFCINIEHAEHVALEFRNAGFKAYNVSGKTGEEERDWILNGLATGDVEVVTSCDVISEGTDIPSITAGFMLRPTASEGLYLQQAGRILRPSPGKKEVFLFDHVGNVMRHGLVELEREWSLDGEVMRKRKQKNEKTIPVKQCESCFTIHEPAPVCPTCGHVYEVKVRGIEEIDGELVELTQEQRKLMMVKKKKEKQQEVSKAKTLEELEAIAAQRGYKPGWAKRKFETRNEARKKYQNQA